MAISEAGKNKYEVTASKRSSNGYRLQRKRRISGTLEEAKQLEKELFEELREIIRSPKRLLEEISNRFSMVYIIENVDTGYIKIGKSTNIPQRIQQIESDLKAVAAMYEVKEPKIKVLYSFKESTVLNEAILHKRFEEFRLPNTEWFKKPEDLQKFLTNLNKCIQLLSELEIDDIFAVK